METKFQTSFIPKKTMAPTSQTSSASGSSTSILLIIGVFLFVVSVLAAAGVYGWQVYLNSQRITYDQALKSLQSNIDVQQIAIMKVMASKIDLATTILQNHVAVSQVFDIISKLTASNIRFVSMDLQAQTDKTNNIKLSLSGVAPSYDALAFQADQLGHLENLDLRNIVTSPLIQDPTQNQNSTVSFTLSANIPPANISYTKSLQSSVGTTAAPSMSSSLSGTANSQVSNNH